MELKYHDRCPACHADSITLLETVPVNHIAEVWSESLPAAGQFLKQTIERGEIPQIVQMAQCPDCQLEFANPMFSAPADWYTQVEQYGVRWEYQQCLQDIRRRGAILEIGCGEGYFLEMAQQSGHQAVGLDFNQSAIAVAQSKGLNAQCWNLNDLKTRFQHPFQSAVFFHVIEHLDDPDRFFSDLSELMPQGSSLHFSCPGARRFTTHLEAGKKVGRRDVWDYPPLHQTRWNQTATEAILTRFGWKLQKAVEEPFHLRGTAGFLVAEELARQGINLADLPLLDRQLRILLKTLKILFAPFRYSGMSLYCMAVKS